MKRLIAGVLIAVGIGALLQRRRRRQAVAAVAERSLADELRARLAESRAAEAEAPAAPAPEEPETDLAARRREVHERARDSIDELGDG